MGRRAGARRIIAVHLCDSDKRVWSKAHMLTRQRFDASDMPEL